MVATSTPSFRPTVVSRTAENFAAGIVDELWLLTTYREEQNYVALETALQKDPEADLIAISTAGYDRESKLGRLYQRGLDCPDVRVSKDGCRIIALDLADGFMMHWYGAPPEADLENPAIVRACNPGSWGDPEAILRVFRRMVAKGDEFEARRLLFNQWTAAKNPWLAPGAWRQLATDDVEVPVGAEIYVAVDAAYSGDCTAVVFAWRDAATAASTARTVWSTSDKWIGARYVENRRSTTSSSSSRTSTSSRASTNPRDRLRPEYFVTEAKHLAQAGFTIAAIYPQSGDMSDAVRAMKRASTKARSATTATASSRRTSNSISAEGDPRHQGVRRDRQAAGRRQDRRLHRGRDGALARADRDSTEFVGGFDWDRGDD
jgi:hypothetical protein